MGEIITFNANLKSKKRTFNFSSPKEPVSYDSTAPRLDSTEKSSFEKACKLAGKDPLARTIILSIIDFATPMDGFVVEFLNDVGIYDNKIPLLYWACDSNPYNFIQCVNCFRILKIPKKEILPIKTKQEFLNLMVKYRVDEFKHEYDYYDEGG